MVQWENAGKPPVAPGTMNRAIRRGIQSGALYARKNKKEGGSAERVFYAHFLDRVVEHDIRPGTRLFHKSTCGTYRVVTRGTMKHEGGLDGVEVAIYVSESGGNPWVRPLNEMLDGRFEKIEEE